MMALEAQLRVIRFLASDNERAQFIAEHIQQRGYGDPSDLQVEVGLRERMAYIVMMGSESSGSAGAWTVDTDARRLRIEAIEAELLAEAFKALPRPGWKALIDACADGPEAAHALARRWSDALEELPNRLFGEVRRDASG